MWGHKQTDDWGYLLIRKKSLPKNDKYSSSWTRGLRRKLMNKLKLYFSYEFSSLNLQKYSKFGVIIFNREYDWFQFRVQLFLFDFGCYL